MTADKQDPPDSRCPADADLEDLHKRLKELEAKLERLRIAVQTHFASLEKKKS